jgi:hypothetical protein
MLSKNKIIFSSVILISLFNIRCDDDNRSNCDFALCTEEFRSVVLIIKYNADHSPYLLSYYKVIRMSDNMDITPISDSFSTSQGYYPVANDIKKELFKFNDVKVEFKGYINNDLVIQRQFTITADCCHISLVEGNTLILI